MPTSPPPSVEPLIVEPRASLPIAAVLLVLHLLAMLPAFLAHDLPAWCRPLWVLAVALSLLVELRSHVLSGRVRRLGRQADGGWFLETAARRIEGPLRARLVTQWFCLVQIGGAWWPRTVAVFRGDVPADAHRRLRRALLERAHPRTVPSRSRR